MSGPYDEMKVVDLQAELKKRKLPYGGLKKALITRLKQDDAKGSKSGPAPKAPKKGATKKAPVKKEVVKEETTKKKVPAKTKPQVKKGKATSTKKKEASEETSKKEKSSEKEEKEAPKVSKKSKKEKTEDEHSEKKSKKEKTDEHSEKKSEELSQSFESKIKIPDSVYTITASNLARLIHDNFVVSKASEVSKFKKLFIELKAYAEETPDKSTIEISTVDESVKERPEEDNSPEETTEEEQVEIKVEYNQPLGIYTITLGDQIYAVDKDTSSIYARVNDGKILQLTKADLSKYKQRLWHIHVKKRGPDDFPSEKEIEELALASKKVTEPVVEEEQDEDQLFKYFESEIFNQVQDLEEEGADGKTETLGTLSTVQDQISKIYKTTIEIDEATFIKYYKAQLTNPDQKEDYKEMARKADMNMEVAEWIHNHYGSLMEKYIKAVTDFKLVTKTQVTKPVHPRQLGVPRQVQPQSKSKKLLED